MIDNPNDPSLRSFIDAAPDSPFPIQNLPFGAFDPSASSGSTEFGWRVGVAIGEQILDLREIARAGMFEDSLAQIVSSSWDTGGIAQHGATTTRAIRKRVSELLRHDNGELRDNAQLRNRAICSLKHVELQMPS